MKKNEKGITLVELLATLTLISLVVGVIWTTVSIATKFNVSETSTLRLQQESNYIISELQQVHRHCYTYKLTITNDEVKVTECMKDKIIPLNNYNKIISNKFHYEPSIDNVIIKPTENDYDILGFKVIDSVVNPKREPRQITVSTTLSRLITEDRN